MPLQFSYVPFMRNIILFLYSDIKMTIKFNLSPNVLVGGNVLWWIPLPFGGGCSHGSLEGAWRSLEDPSLLWAPLNIPSLKNTTAASFDIRPESEWFVCPLGPPQLFADEGGCDWCCTQNSSFAFNNIETLFSPRTFQTEAYCSPHEARTGEMLCCFCPLQNLGYLYVKHMWQQWGTQQLFIC